METFILIAGLVLLGVLIASVAVPYASRQSATEPAPNPWRTKPRRNTGKLWTLVGVAIVFSGLFRLLHTLTGIDKLDGTIGVALGLYICAHPAANAVNILFFERELLGQLSDWTVIRWLALNLLVLLAGWMVIFVGLTRLVASP